MAGLAAKGRPAPLYCPGRPWQLGLQFTTMRCHPQRTDLPLRRAAVLGQRACHELTGAAEQWVRDADSQKILAPFAVIGALLPTDVQARGWVNRTMLGDQVEPPVAASYQHQTAVDEIRRTRGFWVSAGGGPARSPLPGLLLLLAFYLGTWLLTSQLLGARCGGALDRGPDYREDRALQRGGGKDLTPASPGIDGLRRFVMTGREFPHPADDRRGQHPSQHADQQTQGLVLHLSHLLRVPGYGRSLTQAAGLAK